MSAWKRRRWLSIALLLVGVLAPVVVPVVMLVTRGGVVDLALDTSALGSIQVVLIVVVLSRLVAVAEVLVSTSPRPPASYAVALVGMAVVLVPSLWGYGRIGEVTDTFDEVFVSSGSDEPLAIANQTVDGDDFVNVLLIAGDEGSDRWSVRTDTVVLITTHRDSGRTALISIDRSTRNLQFADGSALDRRFPSGYSGVISDVYLDVHDDADLMSAYQRGDLAPEAVALAEGVAQSLDEPIDDYLFVNLKGLGDFVDALDGIDVTFQGELEIPALDDAEASVVGPGKVTIDGSQAYRLVTTRTDVSDYDLMIRQRVIITSIGKSVSGGTILGDLTNLLGILKDSMRSSMSSGEFADFLDRLSGKSNVRENLSLSPGIIDPASPDWSLAATTVDDLQAALAADRPFSG
jgi:LCP family protein required for cell wall assembly